jgi:tRNA uridine 5-carboxymethylaminomethyl modification enzyme
MQEDDDLVIPREMSYSLPGLSREMVEKLSRVQPMSLGQAARIPGVTPAAVAIVRMHLRRGRKNVERTPQNEELTSPVSR